MGPHWLIHSAWTDTGPHLSAAAVKVHVSAAVRLSFRSFEYLPLGNGVPGSSGDPLTS